jgi:hypothetical protein
MVIIASARRKTSKKCKDEKRNNDIWDPRLFRILLRNALFMLGYADASFIQIIKCNHHGHGKSRQKICKNEEETTKFQNSFSFQKNHFFIKSLGMASCCLLQASCVTTLTRKKVFPSERGVTIRKIKTTFMALPPLLIAFTITFLVLRRPSHSCLWRNNASGSFLFW